MKLVCWNVNSINARLPLVIELIKQHNPDILFLQETKCEDQNFPYEALEDLHYNIANTGQKTFNGVAILSKKPFEGVGIKSLPNFEDENKRYLEVMVDGVSYINIYAPQGQDPESSQYPYKLSFYDALYQHLETYIKKQVPFVIAGDFNVALTEEDTSFPDENGICFTIKERQKLNQLLNLGLIDVQRYKEVSGYTYFDYRNRGFMKKQGWRIDYILVAPGTFKAIEKFEIDVDTRGKEKTSDHAPIVMIAG
ncbi:MAG: exodeoxyribonuclease III [Alphaproteobacteria bacterium]|nr:MAG: exodeoxyribonuclease III [Alphaproteobacteria bacterium]